MLATEFQMPVKPIRQQNYLLGNVSSNRTLEVDMQAPFAMSLLV